MLIWVQVGSWSYMSYFSSNVYLFVLNYRKRNLRSQRWKYAQWGCLNLEVNESFWSLDDRDYCSSNVEMLAMLFILPGHICSISPHPVTTLWVNLTHPQHTWITQNMPSEHILPVWVGHKKKPTKNTFFVFFLGGRWATLHATPPGATDDSRDFAGHW